jgi:prophage regulatory protein
MKIIRDARTAEKIGAKSRATPWRLAKSDPDFPKPIKVSGGITGWVESEVDAWLERRVAAARGKRTPA